MDRRTFVAVAAALPFAALGQETRQRVAFFSSTSQTAHGHLLEEFRTGLRSRGYVEGKNVLLDLWWAQDQLDRLPGLAAEMLTTKPAVIVSHGSAALAQLHKATTSVPIVFASVGDPVGQGLVKSFRRPGGNITGIAFNEAVHEKVYELAKTVMPGLSRVAALLNPDNPASHFHRRIIASAKKTLGVEIVAVEVRNAEGLEAAFLHATRSKAQGLVVPAHAPFNGLHPAIIELQFRHRIPTFHVMNEGVEAGGVASYSFPLDESYRRAAAYVDQILKGRSPAEMPVEIPTKYEIAINMKTAKALGLKVPESVLMRAHKVIN